MPGTVQTFATPAAVLAYLRLPPDHPDAQRVADATAEANELVSRWLAIGELQPDLDPVPVGVVNATVSAATRLYRWKDVAGDIADAWGDAGPTPMTPRDPLAGAYDRLAPYRPGAASAPGDVAAASTPWVPPDA